VDDGLDGGACSRRPPTSRYASHGQCCAGTRLSKRVIGFLAFQSRVIGLKRFQIARLAHLNAVTSTAMKGELQRNELLRRLSQAIVMLTRDCPIRVAIDGVDGAGKTMMADELVPFIEVHERPVIRASIDGFHRPRADRYRRGADSPKGFYYDSFDYELLRQTLLDPLGPRGNRLFRTAAFDWRTDSPTHAPVQEAETTAVLLFDGIFAQCPELRDVWDFVILLHVDLEETLRRSLIRDARPDQTSVELERRHWSRYSAGQRIYFTSVQPWLEADIIVDNNDHNKPVLLSKMDAARYWDADAV
jgi:uridine kinase